MHFVSGFVIFIIWLNADTSDTDSMTRYIGSFQIQFLVLHPLSIDQNMSLFNRSVFYFMSVHIEVILLLLDNNNNNKIILIYPQDYDSYEQ